MDSITTLINHKINKFAEKLNKEFPCITVDDVISIWHKQVKKPDSELSEKEALIEQFFLSTFEKVDLMVGIFYLIKQGINKLAEKVHERFPEITVDDVISIWRDINIA